MSVGLPSWREFIRHVASELGLSPDDPIVAENSHHTLAEYYRIKNGSIGPLRSWMDRNWKVSEENIRKSEVHRLIVELQFPIIYTTNFDRNLETAYEVFGRPYAKIANVRDLPRADTGVTQIVKFHGDFEDDESLVLTETDYFDRLNFESPLDIKFRADMLGKPILFIGYSLSDLNIRFLLHRLWRTWRLSGYERERPMAFVCLASANPVQEAVLRQWGLKVMTPAESETPETALVRLLSDLRRRSKADRPSTSRTRKVRLRRHSSGSKPKR